MYLWRGSCVEVISCGLAVAFGHTGGLGEVPHMKCKYGGICSTAASCISFVKAATSLARWSDWYGLRKGWHWSGAHGWKISQKGAVGIFLGSC